MRKWVTHGQIHSVLRSGIAKVQPHANKITSDRAVTFYFLFLSIVLTLGVVGPMITPYEYNERLRTEEGGINRLAEPSIAHPLGTTDAGYDVLSRLLYGARLTVITGLGGGLLIVGLGLSVGVTAGYVGGLVENTLMRFTDLVYGVPLIPTAIVLVTLFGVGYKTTILVIGLVLWRGSARVIRSQVLQIKERPYILAAEATGASTPWVIYKHILPNVAPMAILFFSLGVGYSIITQAGLAFLGVTNPFIPSWGIMIRNAYQSGQIAAALWWVLPPGLMISFTVLSSFMLGRSLSEEDEMKNAYTT